MITIKNETDLDGVTEPKLRTILSRYASLMDLATIFIAEPGDTLDTLASARGWSVDNAEWVTIRDDWLEALWIISDYGDGHLVFVQDRADTDPDLLALFKAHAVQGDD